MSRGDEHGWKIVRYSCEADVAEPRSSPPDATEEWCPRRSDGVHCDCWYDGEPCCSCGAPADDDSKDCAREAPETRDP